jgi:hypothetical protein
MALQCWVKTLLPVSWVTPHALQFLAFSTYHEIMVAFPKVSWRRETGSWRRGYIDARLPTRPSAPVQGECSIRAVLRPWDQGCLCAPLTSHTGPEVKARF